MGTYIIQNDFSRGEFSPLLAARNDLEFFMRGAKKLLNVQVIPQGGLQRRFGTLFIDTVDEDLENCTLRDFIYSPTEKYLLLFYNTHLVIYENDEIVHTIDNAPWTTAQVSSLKFTQSHNLLIITHPDIVTQILFRGGDSNTWTLESLPVKRYPVYDFKKNYNAVTFTLDNPAAGVRNLTSSAAIFSAEYVNGIFIGPGVSIDSPIGYARIFSYGSPTALGVIVISPFGGTPASPPVVTFSGDDVILTQPAWSATLGYPACATFYENRLVFGGSKSLPETLMFSKIGDFYNFDIGRGDADDAIIVTIATDALNNIQHLIANRSLQVFTSNAEFAPPQLDNSPLTPDEIGIRLQSKNGSTNVSPAVLDNSTFYIRAGGKAVMGFMLDGNTQTYNSVEASILAPHLIKQPISSAVLKGSSYESANFLYLVNEDGNISCYQTLQEQNVSAWTELKTQGKWGAITAVEEDIYFLVEREIDGALRVYLEKFDRNTYTDCAIKKEFEVPTKTIIGLEHLEGKLVRIRGDGYVLTSQMVVDGAVTLTENEDAISSAEVGLNFDVEIIPNPVVVNSQQGNLSYKIKRVIRVFLHYFETLGVRIDGTLVPYLEFNTTAFEPPTPKSGIHEQQILDWARQPLITITQTDPLPLTILGIGYEVEVA